MTVCYELKGLDVINTLQYFFSLSYMHTNMNEKIK